MPDEPTGQGIGTTVRVDPAGLDILLMPGEPLMAAARRVGVRWPSVCGGLAQCGVCVVEVTKGDQPMATQREQQMLDRLPARPRHGGTMRLACQLTTDTPLSVTKLGVRKPARI